MTILPALILAAITVPTVGTLFALAKTDDTECYVNVTGQQWWWEFDYPVQSGCGGITEPIVTAGRWSSPPAPRCWSADQPRRDPLVLDPEAERQEGHGPRPRAPAAHRSRRARASTPGSAPSSAGCRTPTCAWRSVALAPADFEAWKASGSSAPYHRPPRTRSPPPASRRSSRSARAATRSTACWTPTASRDLPAASCTCLGGGAQPHPPDEPHHVRRRLVRPAHPQPAGKVWERVAGGVQRAATWQGVTAECLNSVDLRAWLRNAPAKKPMYADPNELRPTDGKPAACPTWPSPRTRSTSSSPTCRAEVTEHRHGHHRTSHPGHDDRRRRRRRSRRRASLASSADRSRPPAGRSWLFTVDHKKIGIMYGVTAMVFFIVGGIEALLIRAQLAAPERHAARRRTSTTRCSRCTPRR